MSPSSSAEVELGAGGAQDVARAVTPNVAQALHTAAGGTFHELVVQYKRELLLAALARHGGNRTHAARALGLQRTYLLRLIRDLALDVPPAPRAWPARSAREPGR
jgi:DNA-binding NtrC family response regulator